MEEITEQSPEMPTEEEEVNASQDPSSEHNDDEGGRFSRLRRKLFEREYSGDARVILETVLETSDKAKTEAVRLVAKEVRNYLDALHLKEGIQQLLTSNTLEIKASFRLRPNTEEEPKSS